MSAPRPVPAPASPLAHACRPGGGNALIRPFQCHPHWRAAGVPTGSLDRSSPHAGGTPCLDAAARRDIADALAQVGRLLATRRFEALAFSWDEHTRLGGRIFDTAQPVRDHIVEGLLEVARVHGVTAIRSTFQGLGREGDFGWMIARQPRTLFVFNDNDEEFRAHHDDPANPYGAAAAAR